MVSKNNYILAVDDTPDNLFLIKLALEQEGYEVDLVQDGYTALKKVKQSPPDLILLDVMMPGISGYEVTQKIRADRSLPFIPILLITAHDESSVVKGLDLGADEFIRKPVKVDELQARVRSLLRLKQTIEQRENFVSCLTHDLRTPLVAVERMLVLIKQGVFGEATPATIDAIDGIIDNNQNLLEMLNNLLEVHCYEVGQKSLNFITFDLLELLESISKELAPLALEKSLELKIDSSSPEIKVAGDRLELRRVFTNIISNAIKFTDRGSIEVKAELVEGGKTALVTVTDTGIGISSESLLLIFERFRQGNHKRAGNGLGLYLCKQIVETHGGKIQVDSQVGEGSKFQIFLPIQPANDYLPLNTPIEE